VDGEEKVGLIRSGVIKTRMGTPAVVEVEISADRAARLADAVKAARCDAVTQTQRISSGLQDKHYGSDGERSCAMIRIPTAVPDLTFTAGIKLNERILLLSIFERIACTTPDNCPRPAQRGEAVGLPTVSFARRSATSSAYEAANETVWRRRHVHRN
jgi:hypothetical protein